MIACATERAPLGVGLVQTRYATWLEPLPLESGAQLAPLTLAFETYGELSPARDNAILILHALSGDAHVAGRHSSTDPKPGWWDAMVGPGRPFDTDCYFIICSNVIGGCKGSTGPSSIDPATGKPYGLRFPVITIGDMVRAQTRLIDHLGIDRLLAVVGGSMGGFQALEWATAYPDRVHGAILLATAARSSAQTVAWNAIGRRAIMADPRWRGGDYYGHEPPVDGLATARMIGHITYLSEPSLERKFGRAFQRGGPSYTMAQEFVIESYLEHQAPASMHASTPIRISTSPKLWTTGTCRRAMVRWRRHSPAPRRTSWCCRTAATGSTQRRSHAPSPTRSAASRNRLNMSKSTHSPVMTHFLSILINNRRLSQHSWTT